MSAATLANAVVRIGVDQSQVRAGLAGVRSQLTGFVGASQLLAGRIGGGLIGAAGQNILASRAQAALGPSRANVAREQGNVAAARAGLSRANGDLRDAQFRLQHATTAATKAAAQSAVYAAKVGVQAAQANVAKTTGNLQQAKAAAEAAEDAFEGTAAGIGTMVTVASAAVGAISALAAGLISLTSAGAALNAAGHNIDLTFGRWGEVAKRSADEQAAAFGRSKVEFLGYVEAVGRQLEVLGVKEEVAAILSTRAAEAISRLAEARRISFGEAAQVAHGTVTDDEVRGYAYRKGLLSGRNAVLDAETAAILRQELEIAKMEAMTEGAAMAGGNWNSQLTLLLGTLENLAATIGSILEPAFADFLGFVNEGLKIVIAHIGWLHDKFMDLVVAMGGADMRVAVPDAGPDAASARNRAMIDQARKDRMAGAMLGGGGGGGGGGFQGDLGGFWKRAQAAAFDQRQVKLMEQQAAAAEKSVVELRAIRENIAQNKKNNTLKQVPWF